MTLKLRVRSLFALAWRDLCSRPQLFTTLTLGVLLPVVILVKVLEPDESMIVGIDNAKDLVKLIPLAKATAAAGGVQLLLAYALVPLFIAIIAQAIAGLHRGEPQVALGTATRLGLTYWWSTLTAAVAEALLVTAGTLLLLVPGIILFQVCYLMIPAAAVEGGTCLQVFQRSRQLMRGQMWLLSKLYLVHMTCAVMPFVFTMIAQASAPLLWSALAVLTSALNIMWFSTVQIEMYLQLKARQALGTP